MNTRLGTARSTVALHRAPGGYYAVVIFPPGLLRGRHPVTGPVEASDVDAVAAALAIAAPVIARIANPPAAPDADG